MQVRHLLDFKFAAALVCLCSALTVSPLFAQSSSLPNIKLGDVQVITSAATPPVFEIALPRAMPAAAQIKLATPYQHAQAGFDYALWLSDATIQLKERRGQAPTLLIQSKRSPPQTQHDLLLDISSNGQSRLVPYVFLTDPLQASSADQPMPEPPPSGEPPVKPQPTLAEVIEQLGQAGAQAQTTTPSASNAPPASSDSNAQRAEPNRQRINRPVAKKAIKATAAAAQPPIEAPIAIPATLPPPATLASEPAASTSASASATPATLPPAAPAAAPPATVTPRPTPQPAANNDLAWLSDPLTWGLVLGVVLLITYLMVRLLMARRAKQAQNAPVLNRETGFQPTAYGAANTVFGLSDAEAVAMQQQWVDQQLLKK